jgi:hypothetical protein
MFAHTLCVCVRPTITAILPAVDDGLWRFVGIWTQLLYSITHVQPALAQVRLLRRRAILPILTTRVYPVDWTSPYIHIRRLLRPQRVHARPLPLLACVVPGPHVVAGHAPCGRTIPPGAHPAKRRACWRRALLTVRRVAGRGSPTRRCGGRHGAQGVGAVVGPAATRRTLGDYRAIY